MKKKRGEFTLSEISKICAERRNGPFPCEDCPFEDAICYNDDYQCSSKTKKMLEKRIDAEEGK